MTKIRATTETRAPHMTWCVVEGCGAHWMGERAARKLTEHVNSTGHHGVGLSAVHIRPADLPSTVDGEHPGRLQIWDLG